MQLLVFAGVILFAVFLSFYYRFRFQPYNMLLMYFMILLSIIISLALKDFFQIHIYTFVIYLVLFIILEVLFFTHIANLSSSEERVASVYQWLNIYLPQYDSWAKTADLTEGYFAGDWSISAEEAMKRKYDFIYDQLKLQPGMKVLDMGSGYCQWLEYLKNRGVEGQGFTLSDLQVASCKERGIKATVQNVLSIPDSYHGMFDAVTIIGSSEHYTNCFVTSQEQTEIFHKLFQKIDKLLQPTSSSQRVFLSGMKMNPHYSKIWGPEYTYHAYLLERHYNGCYVDPGQMEEAASPMFQQILLKDMSEDYRYISIKEPGHFGNFTIRIDSWKRFWYLLFMFITDPYAIHKWLYHLSGSWMWQFGGADPKPHPEWKDTPMRSYFEVYTRA